MQGIIIKIISNQYTIQDGEEKHLALAAGKVRLQVTPVVGDYVEYQKIDDKYVIQKILERHNYLVRPPIANVDQALIVMSAKDPDFSTTLVDRITFLINHANIKPILCITKMDLVKDDKQLSMIIDDYRQNGMEVLECQKANLDNNLANVLNGKITVLTGQSGVGKSTLLNTLDPSFKLQTQETSKALGRGKHTTRHCELHEIAGGWVADTPGFSSLDFGKMDEEDLANSVSEFRPYLSKCKFRNCIHQNEPGCAVKEAVNNGKLSSIRYQNYLDVLKLIQERKQKY